MNRCGSLGSRSPDGGLHDKLGHELLHGGGQVPFLADYFEALCDSKDPPAVVLFRVVLLLTVVDNLNHLLGEEFACKQSYFLFILFDFLFAF